MPDFMVQGQLDDFEKAIESGDVDWIVEKHTDDIVRKMPEEPLGRDGCWKRSVQRLLGRFSNR
ncbi:MAG: hypothetical protein CM15mP45_10780 [Deltaproteobacteria bacterium]|nr:MAG: hypothetical protein CM15mP45_10780 [Deltaproteobacteria bacterium]